MGAGRVTALFLLLGQRRAHCDEIAVCPRKVFAALSTTHSGSVSPGSNPGPAAPQSPAKRGVFSSGLHPEPPLNPLNPHRVVVRVVVKVMVGF